MKKFFLIIIAVTIFILGLNFWVPSIKNLPILFFIIFLLVVPGFCLTLIYFAPLLIGRRQKHSVRPYNFVSFIFLNVFFSLAVMAIIFSVARFFRLDLTERNVILLMSTVVALSVLLVLVRPSFKK